MKKKIFFVALILFIVFLNSMILIVSIVILKDKLSAVRDKCLAEHYVIASSLIGDMQALEQRENHVEENIDNLMRLYSRYLQGRGNGLAVAYSGEWIYESPSFASEENMIYPPDTSYSQERLVYMQNENRPVLCVYGSFPAPWQDYGLMYIGDLSDTIQLWRHTKNILFLAGAVVILIMSFFLFQFLNIIFRPLRQISSASAKIANGNYGSRLQNMAYQLLEMALLCREEMKDSNCSVKELFAESEKVMHVRASEKKIMLTYVLHQNYVVRGNMEQLLILTNNLIDNAIKASRQKDEICIRAYSEKAAIVVEVEDHGTGMEMEQMSHIKEAFYRIDKARSRAAGGAGLGLAICERIIQIHHADMSFISEPGVGTVVKLSFSL